LLDDARTAEERADRERSCFLADRYDAGREADFHSLRHTCGSLLAAAGVHPKMAQSIMRHSTIDLTMSRYTHTFRGQDAAIAALPDLGAAPAGQRARATSTDDAAALPDTPGSHRSRADGQAGIVGLSASAGRHGGPNRGGGECRRERIARSGRRALGALLGAADAF